MDIAAILPSDEEPVMPLTKQQDLASRIMAVGLAVASVVNAWSLPLWHSDFDTQPEIRNKLFVLLINGMLDASWEFKVRLNALQREAEKLQSRTALHYLPVFSAHIALVNDMVCEFTREEMIYMTELRNQWLHGTWTEVHKTSRTVYFGRERRIVREKLPSKEYWEITRVARMPVDDHLTPLRERLTNKKTFLWAVTMSWMTNPAIISVVQEDLLTGGSLAQPRGMFIIPEPDFVPDASNDAYFALKDTGNVIPEGQLLPRVAALADVK